MKHKPTVPLLALAVLLCLSGCTAGDSTARRSDAADSGTYGSGSHGTPGYNDATDSESSDDFLTGRSYEEMLRDGRVRDTDGFLTDDADRRS